MADSGDHPRKPKGRSGPGVRRILILAVALAMALFHLYTAGMRMLPGIQQRTVHLSFVLALIFLLFPFKAKKDANQEGKVAEEGRPLNVADAVFLCLSFFIGVYVFVDYEEISFRIGMPSLLDSACSFLAIVLVLEATRRLLGWSIIIICMVCFGYLAVGSHLPAFIAHTGFTFEQVINFMFFSTDGILGPALAVSSTVIAVFIIFGAFLQVSGTGPLFIDVGMSLFGRFRGGPAKASVMADSLFGMITGSQVANVAAVGTFTIPFMKKAGYKAETAAAIEAVGSTGAMIMPPVMGAAAFIIPEIIGGTYLDVVKAAIIPGVLFYASLYMFVEIHAAKTGLKRIPGSEIPCLGKVIRERGYLFFPVAVLVYFLVVKATSAPRAAFWAVVAAVIVSQFRKDTRMGLFRTVSAMEKGAKGTLIVAICCASAGIITGTIGMAAIGERFSDILITVASGKVLPLLVLTMFASLVLGLPLPPVTCYLILAVLAAPALIKEGIHPMAAHLFVFFYGTLGNISPPVAPTSFTAAGIANTDPVRTTNLTFLYSLPAWLIPFLFVYSNEVLLMGNMGYVALRIVTSCVALCTMVVAFQGYLFSRIGWLLRSGFLLAGLALIYPHWASDVIGYMLLAVCLSLHVISRRAPGPAKGSRCGHVNNAQT